MTAGGFVRLIFRKDVRRYMWPLGLVFGLGLAVALTLPWAGKAPAPFLFTSCFFLTVLSTYLIVLFLTMDVIQTDSPARDLRFLFTRPVRGETIFFAKILFLGLLLIPGGWGLKELDYAASGVPLQPLDHLCLLIETTIHFGAAMALVGLFTLFLRKNNHVLLALGFFLAAIPFLAYLSAIIFPGIAVATPERNHAQLCWDGLVFLLSQWAFIGLVLVTALVRYRTRKFGLPIALVISGVILDLAVCGGADKIGENRLAHDQTKDLPPYLSIRVHPGDISPLQAEQTSLYVVTTYHTVVRGTSVEGVDPPYYVQVVGSQSTATLRSGKILHSVYLQNPPPATDDGMDIPFKAKVIGVSAAVPGVSYAKPGFTLRAFTYLPSRLPAGEDLTGATINGVVQLEIHRAYVAGSIPLEPGAVFTQPRQRYEITGVFGSPAGVFLNLTYAVRPLILRGDTGDSDILSWALVSRPRNEMIGQGASGGAGSTPYPIEISTSHMLYSPPAAHLLPPDWRKGAELVFLGNETCGQVTVPYQIKDVTLTR